jgi:hypothetical protein
VGHREVLAAIAAARRLYRRPTPGKTAQCLAWWAAGPASRVDRSAPGLRQQLGPGWRATLLAMGRRLAAGEA